MKKTYFEKMLQQYVGAFPAENEKQQSFANFVQRTITNEDLFDRSNQNGHITVSGIIICRQSSRVLLLKHKVLQKLLHPGGHVEKSDMSLLDAVHREVYEETKIDKSDLVCISLYNNNKPIDINCHVIPDNKNKGEKRHVHYDLCYAFLYSGKEIDVEIALDESLSFMWVNMTELAELNGRYTCLVPKIIRLLSYEHRPKIFYDAIVSSIKPKIQGLSYKAIVVAHILPDCMFSLCAIDELTPIIGVIPKPKSIDKDARINVERQFNVIDITRESLLNDMENSIIKLILENDNIVIFDIGGYFARITETWDPAIYSKICCIIEDTENGVQKYEQGQNTIPIISVARSPLKDNEDFLVGQSILFSTDFILRKYNNLFQYMHTSIMGFGKIGKSIAVHLQKRGNKPMVYDTNPIKRVEAFNNLCLIPDRNKVISTADLIFCATGNKSLGIEDFRELKNGCFVVTVTSSEDELETSYITEYKREVISDHIFKYSNSNNYFYLCNDGQAVNFLHNAVIDSFIHLVKGEMIFGLPMIANKLSQPISSVEDCDRKYLAQMWLDIFDPENRSCNGIGF